MSVAGPLFSDKYFLRSTLRPTKYSYKILSGTVEPFRRILNTYTMTLDIYILHRPTQFLTHEKIIFGK